ncbi:MAG: tetratricopeptide repeat protein [Rhodothermales bacterium]
MSIFRAINPFIVLSFSLLVATGCNAFEFMYSEDSDEPDVLLDDARIALQNGDAEKAIGLLEKALEKAPENSEIKIQLSSALFQANDIDLLVMKDLAEFISETPASKRKIVQFTAATNMPACNFRDDISTTTTLDFSQDPAYQLLLGNVDVLQRALDLLYDTLGSEDAAALSENILSNAHLMRAISNMAVSIIEIKLQADAAQASLHRLPNGSIGYCAENDAALAQLESFIVCEKLPAIDMAVSDLVSRQALFSSSDSELADAVASAREEITRAITVSCQPAN